MPVQDTPGILIEDLTPDTDYEARISVYEDYTNRVLGRSTEVIQFRTLAGCVTNDTSVAVGGFNLGCEESCECLASGEVRCQPRCRGPEHRKGQFQVTSNHHILS